MKKLIIITALLSIVSFWGCKKKSPTPQPQLLQIGTLYDDSSHTLYYYYYAPDKRIAGVHDNLGKYWTYFHYNGSQIEAKETVYGQVDSSVPIILYLANNQGLVDSSFEVFPNGTMGMRKKFTYDANGYIVGVQWFNRQNIALLNEGMIISNGNIAQHTYMPVDSADQSLPRGTSTFDFYTDKNNTIGNNYSGQQFLGSSSKNPVKSWTYINGSITTKADYTYNYDQSNYITSQLVYQDSLGIMTHRVDSISYVYYSIQ